AVGPLCGGSNAIDATHVSGTAFKGAGRILEIGEGEFAGPGKPMSICVKTHDVELLSDPRADGANTLSAIVRGQTYVGSHRDYVVDVGQELLVAAPASLNLPRGVQVTVRFRPERCRGLVH